MSIPPERAAVGNLDVCGLVNECLDFGAGEGMSGFVAALDVHTARVGWYWQFGFVSW